MLIPLTKYFTEAHLQTQVFFVWCNKLCSSAFGNYRLFFSSPLHLSSCQVGWGQTGISTLFHRWNNVRYHGWINGELPFDFAKRINVDIVTSFHLGSNNVDSPLKSRRCFTLTSRVIESTLILWPCFTGVPFKGRSSLNVQASIHFWNC